MRTTRMPTLSAAAAPSLFSLFAVGASSPGGGLGGAQEWLSGQRKLI